MALNPVFINRANTIDNAKKKIYKIQIGSRNGNVTGFLTNEFQIRTDAKWDPIFNVDGWFGSTQKSLGVLNLGAFNTGFWSQLYFKNGGYIILTPEFRIVDWNETDFKFSPTIHAAQVLTSCCFPTGGAKSKIQGLQGNTTLGNVAKSAGQAAKDFLFTPAKQAADSAFDAGKQVVDLALDPSTSEANGILAATANIDLSKFLSKSPSPVSIKIGEFFNYSNMIVEAVDCKFSKEMTRRGPLYVDVKLELKSLTRPTSSGLSFPGGKRVTTTDSKNRKIDNGKGKKR